MPMSTNMALNTDDHDFVTIKGMRKGLLFRLADDIPFEQLIDALNAKLGHGSSHFSTAGNITVYLDYGEREVTPEIQETVQQAFLNIGDVSVQVYEEQKSDEPTVSGFWRKQPYVFKGTLRSGQVIEHDGDVIVIGNVNPSATIVATGDIYVFGRLRGFVHAGAAGNVRAIVAAAYFEPIQVRIASVIRRSPETYGHAAEMEFAYLEGDQMAVERMAFLQHFQSFATPDRAVI